MCLNVLRCLGVSTGDQNGDTDVGETSTCAHAPAEEAARIYSNGNGLHHPPKSTKADTAHHPREQHHDERPIEMKTEALSGSGERSPVKANQEESPREYSAAGNNRSKESPRRDYGHEAFAGANKTKESARRGHDDDLRGATVPAHAATYAGQYEPAFAKSTYADEASVKSTWTSQEQGTARRGQLKTPEVDDGRSSWRRSSEASDVETRRW